MLRLSDHEQTKILGAELKKVGYPLSVGSPGPLGIRQRADIRERACQILAEKGIERFGATDFRHAVRQALGEVIEREGEAGRLGDPIAERARLDVVRAQLGDGTFDPAALTPEERSTIIDTGAKAILANRGIDLDSVNQAAYRDAALEVERVLTTKEKAA